LMLYSYSPAEDRATLESDLSADRGARCRGRAASFALFSAPAEAPKAIKYGIKEATLYRWRAKYKGLGKSEAKRLKVLEDENRQLKRLVAGNI